VNYDENTGTSMACPHVSGVAGLIWSHFDAAKSAQVIRDTLTSTALDLGAPGRDDEFGFGMVRACNAAQALGVSGLSCFDTSSCVDDADCNDGNFCNGLETCNVGTRFCQAGTGPCTDDESCNEDADTCVAKCAEQGDSCQDSTDCCSGNCASFFGSQACK
jgi:hypothetical protein